VAIAGVVFNSLTQDMDNWSSYYGYNGTGTTSERIEGPARDEEALALAEG
jgi:hypothetical protein